MRPPTDEEYAKRFARRFRVGSRVVVTHGPEWLTNKRMRVVHVGSVKLEGLREAEELPVFVLARDKSYRSGNRDHGIVAIPYPMWLKVRRRLGFKPAVMFTRWNPKRRSRAPIAPEAVRSTERVFCSFQELSECLKEGSYVEAEEV